MTRVLSELLGAHEPLFSRGLKQLEILSGHPRADIRLSSSVQQQTARKMHELGLDAHDTTGPELYHVLGARLPSDELQFVAAIGGNDNIHIVKAVQRQLGAQSGFGLKAAPAKRILKANLPKKTMKALGYRSADSMLKHETAATLFAAAWLIESEAWAKRTVTAYSKLQASDFEQRPLVVEHPSSSRWQDVVATFNAAAKHTILGFKELGAVVVLPLPAMVPASSSLTAAVLTLHACNEVLAAGTYLKLHQMQSNFGAIVQQIVISEPMLPAAGFNEPFSWHNLHQYFARFSPVKWSDIFEPMVAGSELVWTPVEQAIAAIAPALEFWKDTANLALLSGGKPVSCNLTDVLLNHGNAVSFDNRLVQHFRQSLRSELLLSYLNHDMLEQTVFSTLQGRLAPEMAMN